MKKSLRFLVPLLLVILIIASIGWYLFVYDRDFTRDVLLSQARYHTDKGNDKLGSWFYNLAYEHTGQDENVAIELANQYKADGNYTKAEFTLTNAIADTGGTVELYTALCQTYIQQNKTLDAVNMLNNIGNESIRTQLDAMRPAAPEADWEPGFYSQYISISLTCPEGCTIYYTLDGEFPSTTSTVYTGPFMLSAGETVIQAVCVSENGLISPLATMKYTVGGVIELVTFADPAIEASVREILNMDADDEIYTNDLWTITEYIVPAEAEVLDDVALMTHLQTLTVQDRKLENLAFLSNLTKLETLDLSGCRFPSEELAVIAVLPQLQNLNLSNCGLSTIADLAGARNLVTLDLSYNTLRNLEVLSPITTLTQLNLCNNAVNDLSYLSGLTNLSTLDISFNAVTTLEPLATCQNLTWLNADNNTLSGLTTVDKLPLLTYLSVENNGLTDVAILARCTGLTELSIANNKVSDITMLYTLTKLEIFDFSYNSVRTLPQWGDGCALRTIDGSYNSVSDISVLAKMDNLTYVYMDYNALTSVDSIANCYNLVLVNVYGNPISDVSALLKDSEGNDKGIIVNYDPTQG